MGIEKENVGELVGIEDRNKLSLCVFKTQEGEIRVSVFKDAIAPKLDEGATYRFKTVVYNGYTNLAPTWAGKTKSGYKIEKIAERIPPREEVRIPASAPSVKIDARELRISRLSLTSSSCIVAAALINEGKMVNAKEAEDFVLAFAGKLEKYALSTEAV